MNKRILSVVLLSLVALVSAQTAPKLSSPAPMEHRGFYNSVSFGAAYNWYENSKNEKTNTTMDARMLLIAKSIPSSIAAARSR
ncbi:hypothetical protein SAMN05720762_103121 [Fibrobacter sp. UWH4]|nr:hypothetical protein SAMN05720762_103121 [Fibrobacter sp. UWH4]